MPCHACYHSRSVAVRYLIDYENVDNTTTLHMAATASSITTGRLSIGVLYIRGLNKPLVPPLRLFKNHHCDTGCPEGIESNAVRFGSLSCDEFCNRKAFFPCTEPPSRKILT